MRWLSLMCGPLSQIQEINSLMPKSKEKLQELRDWRELAFAKTVFTSQAMSRRCAHLEHPCSAKSWQTGSFML